MRFKEGNGEKLDSGFAFCMSSLGRMRFSWKFLDLMMHLKVMKIWILIITGNLCSVLSK